MSDTVIKLESVSLKYRLAEQKATALKEYFIHWVNGSLAYKELWALQEVDLEVRRGEVLGVVGRNGAGKSTLSKVISGVLPATRGTCTVNGLVSPILELGTGFDPELTGHENIFLNALLRGHRQGDIEAKLEDIIEFSGLRDFINSPVRNYSTGMMARLGFSVATAWQPDVLVLDEVLAVGDARFLNRCHERINRFCSDGTTVLIVSHSPSEILNHCTRCLWMDGGRIQAQGTPAEVLRLYAVASDDETTLTMLDAHQGAAPVPFSAEPPATADTSA